METLLAKQPRKKALCADADSTERRRVEEALKASEVRYRRLFETAKDGILILDAETGKIVDSNSFLEKMLGYSHAELLGKKLSEIGSFKDIAAHRASFQELQHSGQLMAMTNMSAGVAAAPEHGSTMEELLRAADEALYAAKDAGRNCVAAYQPQN